MRYMLLSVLAVSMSLCGGCALVDNEVRLRYAGPPPAATCTKGRVAVPVAQERFALVRNKNNRLVVGAVRNSFGGKTADVISEDSPGRWVQAAVLTELRGAGYDAVPVEAPTAPGPEVVVSTEVLALSNETEVNFWTVGDQVTLRVKFRVHRGTNVLAEFESIGRSDHRSPVSTQAAKQAAYDASIAAVMKDALPKLEAALAGA